MKNVRTFLCMVTLTLFSIPLLLGVQSGELHMSSECVLVCNNEEKIKVTYEILKQGESFRCFFRDLGTPENYPKEIWVCYEAKTMENLFECCKLIDDCRKKQGCYRTIISKLKEIDQSKCCFESILEPAKFYGFSILFQAINFIHNNGTIQKSCVQAKYRLTSADEFEIDVHYSTLAHCTYFKGLYYCGCLSSQNQDGFEKIFASHDILSMSKLFGYCRSLSVIGNLVSEEQKINVLGKKLATKDNDDLEEMGKMAKFYGVSILSDAVAQEIKNRIDDENLAKEKLNIKILNNGNTRVNRKGCQTTEMNVDFFLNNPPQIAQPKQESTCKFEELFPDSKTWKALGCSEEEMIFIISLNPHYTDTWLEMMLDDINILDRSYLEKVIAMRKKITKHDYDWINMIRIVYEGIKKSSVLKLTRTEIVHSICNKLKKPDILDMMLELSALFPIAIVSDAITLHCNEVEIESAMKQMKAGQEQFLSSFQQSK